MSANSPVVRLQSGGIRHFWLLFWSIPTLAIIFSGLLFKPAIFRPPVPPAEATLQLPSAGGTGTSRAEAEQNARNRQATLLLFGLLWGGGWCTLGVFYVRRTRLQIDWYPEQVSIHYRQHGRSERHKVPYTELKGIVLSPHSPEETGFIEFFLQSSSLSALPQDVPSLWYACPALTYATLAELRLVPTLEKLGLKVWVRG
jgi:hypothetical protein